MKTAFLTAFGGILLAACANNPASAHNAAREVLPQNYSAISSYQESIYTPRDRTVLHGPTNDPTSTATGGPSGGFN